MPSSGSSFSDPISSKRSPWPSCASTSASCPPGRCRNRYAECFRSPRSPLGLVATRLGDQASSDTHPDVDLPEVTKEGEEMKRIEHDIGADRPPGRHRRPLVLSAAGFAVVLGVGVALGGTLGGTPTLASPAASHQNAS